MASTTNPGALKLAAAEGKLDQVKDLIEKQNVDVNQPDEFGDTALHAASQNAREDIVKYLLEKGADPNVRNKTGSTPLHKLVASRYEQKSTLKRLLAAKADPNIRNNAGMLPEQLVRNKTILLELLKDEAITEEVDVPKASHGRVIGRQGQKMTEIRDETHCIISVPGPSDASSIITIVGRKEGVARAKVLIQEAVAGPKQNKDGEVETAAVTVKYPLAKDLYKFVIGKNGRTINEIRDETGVQIIVPKGDEGDGAIQLKGDQEGIDQAIKRIREVTLASKPPNGSPRAGGERGNGDRRGSRDNNNNYNDRRGSGQGGERRPYNDGGRRGSGQTKAGGESSDSKPNQNEDGTPRIQFMGWGDFVKQTGGQPQDKRRRPPRKERPAEGSDSPAPSNDGGEQ